MTKQLDELVTYLKSLTDEELRDLATTPEWALFIYEVYRTRPGEPLTLERIEMDSRICRQWPCSTEFYRAQVELNRQRFEHSPNRRSSNVAVSSSR
jgi:hypothetical protein